MAGAEVGAIKTFTPWMWGAVVVNSVWIALYAAIGRHIDPVGFGFLVVATVTVNMLASAATEIVHAIKNTRAGR